MQNAERVSAVGVRVRQRRIAAAWGQQELAARAGVSVRTVRNIESGRVAQPHTRSIRRVLAALGVAEQPGPALYVQVLGPLALHRDSAPVPLRSERLRALLGVLAIQQGTTVGRDEIIDVLWGTHPPRTSHALVNTYVAQLRAALEPDRPAGRPASTVIGVTGGYMFDVEPESLDLARFDDLLRRGLDSWRDGDLAGAWRRLDAALACWRGPALVGAGERLAQHPAAVAAADRRITAASALADVGLAVGEPGRVVARLRPIAADEPLHEGMHARLMLALAAAGQHADALAVFANLRARLADELGIEPGAEARAAHLRVLRREVAAVQPEPFQLPAAVPAFVGRAAQLRRLDELTGDSPGEGPVVCAITGTAGVGKTSLAVQWGHRNADRFPGGLLYVDLRGFDPAGEPAEPEDVIRDFLLALGVPPDRIPPGPQALAGLYRSRLAGRRLLLVLDNARDADQVRPLFSSTAGAVVLITSRYELTSLVAGGAYPIAVDLMSNTEATTLLRHRLGASRLAAEPVAAQQVIDRCARLPLAITVAAARVAGHAGSSLADLADELDDAHRALDALDGGDAYTDVRALLAGSYRQLGPADAHLFRLLGLHPGPDIGIEAAAGLAGTTGAAARAALSRLARANLVTRPAPGRFGLHDLLRRYAVVLSLEIDGEPRQRAALLRLTTHYVWAAERAERRLDDGAGATLRWYDDERRALLGCLRLAAGQGLDREAAALAVALTELFDRRGHWQDWAAATTAGLAAAYRLGDQVMQARLHRSRARAEVWLRNPDVAHEHLRRAMRLFAETGDPVGLAHAHRTFAWSLGRLGERRQAADHARAAVALHRSAGDRAGQGLSLNTLGWQHAHLGEHAVALRFCREAVVLLSTAGDHNGVGYALDSLGYIHVSLGDHAAAAAHYRRAVTMFQQTGDRYQEAETLVRLGDAEDGQGSCESARQAWRRAADILGVLRHPDADAVRARLSRQPVLGRAC